MQKKHNFTQHIFNDTKHLTSKNSSTFSTKLTTTKKQTVTKTPSIQKPKLSIAQNYKASIFIKTRKKKHNKSKNPQKIPLTCRYQIVQIDQRRILSQKALGRLFGRPGRRT